MNPTELPYLRLIQITDLLKNLNICHYLSPYYLWEQNAMMKLKENIIKKWPLNDFCNVNLFLELMSFRNRDIDPTVYFWKSEDYFQYLMTQWFATDI